MKKTGGSTKLPGELVEGKLFLGVIMNGPKRQGIGTLFCPAFDDVFGEIKVRRQQAHA